MCGIIGANFELDKNVLNIIAHRGPDARGVKVFKEKDYFLFLGHTRLSIIDLSESANQPMCDKKEEIWIVYNGEIYNFWELRKELEKKGYKFRTKGDTEVLIYLYKEYGIEFLDRLNGIFSFCIYDKRKDILFLARDHFGIKPLYYYHDGNRFIFSSELKVILKQNFKFQLNPVGIVNYLSFLYSPSPHTPVKEVKKLPPAHYMIFDLKNRKLVIKKWWYYEKFLENKLKVSENEAVKLVERELLETVNRQVIADVNVGFFLSGGLDSSLLVALYRRLFSNLKPCCFTIYSSADFSEQGYSDIFYARQVAKNLEVDLVEIKLFPDVITYLKEVVYFLDEPQGDPAVINTKLISEKAKQMGYKVLLSGTGGDDIFTGYRRHELLWWHAKFKKMFFLIKAIKKLIEPFPVNFLLVRRIKLFLNLLSYKNPILESFRWTSVNIMKKILHPNFWKEHRNIIEKNFLSDFFKEVERYNLHEIDKILYLESKGFLPDHNLNYMDKMGMSQSVEIRVPYLDKELVELVASLPPHLKMKERTTKYLLKKIAEKYLPKEVIYRKKVGFGAPLRRWLRKELKDYVEEYLSPKKLEHFEIFNPKGVKQLIELNAKGKVDVAYTIYQILVMQIWFELFLENGGKL